MRSAAQMKTKHLLNNKEIIIHVDTICINVTNESISGIFFLLLLQKNSDKTQEQNIQNKQK